MVYVLQYNLLITGTLVHSVLSFKYFVGRFICIEKFNPCISCCSLNRRWPLFGLSTNNRFYCIVYSNNKLLLVITFNVITMCHVNVHTLAKIGIFTTVKKKLEFYRTHSL